MLIFGRQVVSRNYIRKLIPLTFNKKVTIGEKNLPASLVKVNSNAHNSGLARSGLMRHDFSRS